MRLAERLWPALKERPRLSGVRQVIRDSLGPDYELAVPFIVPSGKSATRYPCQFPSGLECPRRVIRDRDGSIRAVCGNTPRECDSVALLAHDIEILRFDAPKFAQALQQQLGVSGECRFEANGDLITIGTIKPASGKRLPVVLMMAESHQRAEVLTAKLEREYRQGAVLLTPTEHCIDPVTEGRLVGAGFTWLVLADLLLADSTGLTVKFKLVDAMVEKPTSVPNHAVATMTGDRVFRKEGQIWTLTFDSATVRMRDAKGLFYMCELLRCPGQQISAAALTLAAAGRLVSPIALGSAGEILSDPAILNYRERRAELDSEIDQAERNCDLGRKETLEEEREQIDIHLHSALGKGGRRRRASDDVERIRKAVSKAISEAIAAIRKQHGPLADHLQRFIDRGAAALLHGGRDSLEFFWAVKLLRVP